MPESTTLEKFLELLREHNFSRVPVYAGSLDNITGIAFAHDLLQIADEEARTRTVASIQRPAVFVPETKRGYELLREMQREKQHMRIVIDEYGGVSGLVTIEDLLEQIVGDIRDEHEEDAPIEEPQREPNGVWLVPGSFPVDQLADLFGEQPSWPIWATPTKPPRSAAWSARSRAAFRCPARWCCSKPPACASRWSPRPTAASSGCGCSRPPPKMCPTMSCN